MARRRFVHPAIWSDGRIQEMTRDERLLFVGMITLQDDEGRLVASPVSLRGAIYPEDKGLTDAKVEKWRDYVCIRNENVWLYEVGGRQYIWLARAVPKWNKPDHPTPSELPPPKAGRRIEGKELLAKYSRMTRAALVKVS